MSDEGGVTGGVKEEAEKSVRGGRRTEEGRTEYLRRKKIHEGFNKKLQ